MGCIINKGVGKGGKGLPRKKSRKMLYDVGINDFDYAVKVDGIHIPEYKLWNSMLLRCYNKKHHIRQPSYKDCFVEEYLHSFTNFYNFIHTLKGYGQLDENEKPFQLDKDILLKNNKCYNRDVLCFVPQSVNKFLTLRQAKRGDFLIGVSQDKKYPTGNYVSTIIIDGKQFYIGSFKTEIEAHLAYKEAKEQQAKVLAERWKDKIDERVYNALMNYKVEVTD